MSILEETMEAYKFFFGEESTNLEQVNGLEALNDGLEEEAGGDDEFSIDEGGGEDDFGGGDEEGADDEGGDSTSSGGGMADDTPDTGGDSVTKHHNARIFLSNALVKLNSTIIESATLIANGPMFDDKPVILEELNLLESTVALINETINKEPDLNKLQLQYAVAVRTFKGIIDKC